MRHHCLLRNTGRKVKLPVVFTVTELRHIVCNKCHPAKFVILVNVLSKQPPLTYSVVFLVCGTPHCFQCKIDISQHRYEESGNGVEGNGVEVSILFAEEPSSLQWCTGVLNVRRFRLLHTTRWPDAVHSTWSLSPDFLVTVLNFNKPTHSPL